MEIRNGNQRALIVLHEIYGINRFIEEVCADYAQLGYDVFCPNMLGRKFFPYEAEKEAYHYFLDEVGFGDAQEITAMAVQLKDDYERVFILGLSVGATIAWQVAAKGALDGVVCCYGSRIRDYLDLQPICPTLLLFASKENFPVEHVAERISRKPQTKTHLFLADHGFLDSYGNHYSEEQALKAKEIIGNFLLSC